MDDYNKPNVVLPLVASYNQREEAIASAAPSGALKDQRMVNCYQEAVGNQIYLVKRPGFSTKESIIIGGDSIIGIAPGEPTQNNFLAFWAGGPDVKVIDNSLITASVDSGLAPSPVFYDTTILGGLDFGVLQTRSASVQRAFFAASVGAWTEISDAGFIGLSHRGKMEHMDGFAFVLAANGRIHNSDLNTLETWPATNFIAKQIRSDIPIGLARLGRQLLAFASGSVEVFFNAGNATGSPLQRIPERAADIGLHAAQPYPFTNQKQYYAVIDGVLYFVGRQGVSQLSTSGEVTTAKDCGVFKYDGEKFTKISPVGVDMLLNNFSVLSVNKISFFGNQAIAFEMSSTWVMYFPNTNSWFEWSSSVARPRNNGRYFTPAGNTGPLSRFYSRGLDGTDVGYFDGVSSSSTSILMSCTFKLPKNSNHRESMAWAGVVADSISASASTTANGDARLLMSFSDNDYQSFGLARVIDLTQRKKQIYRCGSYEDRAVRLVHSGNAECRIQAFIAKTM